MKLVLALCLLVSLSFQQSESGNCDAACSCIVYSQSSQFTDIASYTSGDMMFPDTQTTNQHCVCCEIVLIDTLSSTDGYNIDPKKTAGPYILTTDQNSVQICANTLSIRGAVLVSIRDAVFVSCETANSGYAYFTDPNVAMVTIDMQLQNLLLISNMQIYGGFTALVAMEITCGVNVAITDTLYDSFQLTALRQKPCLLPETANFPVKLFSISDSYTRDTGGSTQLVQQFGWKPVIDLQGETEGNRPFLTLINIVVVSLLDQDASVGVLDTAISVQAFAEHDPASHNPYIRSEIKNLEITTGVAVNVALRFNNIDPWTNIYNVPDQNWLCNVLRNNPKLHAAMYTVVLGLSEDDGSISSSKYCIRATHATTHAVATGTTSVRTKFSIVELPGLQYEFTITTESDQDPRTAFPLVYFDSTLDPSDHTHLDTCALSIQDAYAQHECMDHLNMFQQTPVIASQGWVVEPLVSSDPVMKLKWKLIRNFNFYDFANCADENDEPVFEYTNLCPSQGTLHPHYIHITSINNYIMMMK